MKLRTNQLTLASTLLLGAVLTYGCGDDDSPAPQPSGEDAGTGETNVSSGETSTAASSSEGGESSTNGAQSSAEETSSTFEVDSGVPNVDSGVPDGGTETGSESTDGDTSSDSTISGEVDSGVTDVDGSVDTEEPPAEFVPVENVSASVVTFANDLRGMTFNGDGSKFFASGFVDSGTPVDRKLVVARFNANGTLDTAFGEDGYVVHNLVERTEDVSGETPVVTNDGDEQSLSLVELSNGNLLLQANVTAASGVGTDVVLLKLDAEGERVATFGTNGVLRVDFGWAPEDDAAWPTEGTGPVDTSWDIKLDPSSTTEKVVVFGHGPPPPVAEGETQRVDSDRYVLRLLASDGSADPEFTPYHMNTGGTFPDNGRRGHINADGSILSAGYTNFGDGLGNHVVAVRLLADGTPDPAFGFGIGLPGVVRSNPFVDDGGAAECYAFLPQSTGRYVSTGYGRATAAGSSSRLGWATTDAVDLVSLGFTASGLDVSYGRQATMAIQSEEQAGFTSTEDRGRDMVVLSDDRVVHAGRFGDFPAVFVTLPNGEPDLDSGLDGRFQFDPLVDPDAERATPTSHFFKVALSPDGKSIAATTNNHPGGVLVTVLRVGAE